MKQTVLKCSPVTVRLWRNRWKLFEGVTIQIEGEIVNETANKVGLLYKIKEILTDLPRAGSSSRITNPEKDRLIALACEPPKKYGAPLHSMGT